MSPNAHHEDYRRGRRAEGPNDRSFGLTFAVVFALIAAWPLLHGEGPRPWALAIMVLLALVSAVRPGLLRPLNRAWMRFGLLLQRVTTPVVLALAFYLVVLPTGLLMRLFGKRPLRLEIDPEADSYWVRRDPRVDELGSMTNQF